MNFPRMPATHTLTHTLTDFDTYPNTHRSIAHSHVRTRSRPSRRRQNSVQPNDRLRRSPEGNPGRRFQTWLLRYQEPQCVSRTAVCVVKHGDETFIAGRALSRAVPQRGIYRHLVQGDRLLLSLLSFHVIVSCVLAVSFCFLFIDGDVLHAGPRVSHRKSARGQFLLQTYVVTYDVLQRSDLDFRFTHRHHIEAARPLPRLSKPHFQSRRKKHRHGGRRITWCVCVCVWVCVCVCVIPP